MLHGQMFVGMVFPLIVVFSDGVVTQKKVMFYTEYFS